MTHFHRGLALCIVVLVLLVGVFGALNLAQGPKLASAQVDPAGVVTQSGQQLRLFANQAVATVATDQVTVTPAAVTSVSTSGDVIAVEFDEPLRYDTEYTVEIAGVTSVYVDQPETLRYSFRTASPELYYLDRGEAVDEIIRTGITSTDREVVYAAASIQDYAVFDGVIAVVTVGDDDSSNLSLVNDAGNVENVALPSMGTIDNFRANASTGFLGFTFTGASSATERLYSDTLLTMDLNSGRLMTEVVGLDGQPVSALDWDFVPLGTRLVVHSTAQNVFLVDTAGERTITPVGPFSALDSISTDGTTIVVTDPFGAVAVTLADGSATRLDPSAFEGEIPSGGTAVVLPGGDWVQQIALLDVSTGRFSSMVVVDDGTNSRALFRTVNDAGSVVSFALSPNYQYVAIETVPNVATSSSDGYPSNSQAQEITTVFVDISSGAVVKSIEGFRVSW